MLHTVAEPKYSIKAKRDIAERCQIGGEGNRARDPGEKKAFIRVYHRYKKQIPHGETSICSHVRWRKRRRTIKENKGMRDTPRSAEIRNGARTEETMKLNIYEEGEGISAEIYQLGRIVRLKWVLF